MTYWPPFPKSGNSNFRPHQNWCKSWLATSCMFTLICTSHRQCSIATTNQVSQSPWCEPVVLHQDSIVGISPSNCFTQLQPWQTPAWILSPNIVHPYNMYHINQTIGLLLSGTTLKSHCPSHPPNWPKDPISTIAHLTQHWIPTIQGTSLPSHWRMYLHTDICHAHKSSIILDLPHI